MRSTTAVTASLLADHAGSEVLAQGGEIDALLVVEDRHGQAGELRQRGDHLLRVDALAGLGAAGDGELDQVEHAAGKARRCSGIAARR